jgi:dTMP kinase
LTKGKFITFEGGDGVGKTTQVDKLSSKLIELGFKVRVTREPGGDKVGEKIRDVLKSSASEMDPLCETLLLFAARRDHFVKLISPLLEQGYFVISDRFYDSSLVYQGVLKNVDVENIMSLKRMTIGDFEPDLAIVLDMEVDVSMRRLLSRNFTLDESILGEGILDDYDSMSREKHNIIRNGFRKIAEIFSFRSVLIDASGNEEKVFAKVMKAVDKILV